MGLQKPSVRFMKEPLRYVCNEAFFAVRRFFPKSWTNAPIAFIEGAVAGYFAADFLTSCYGEAAVLPNIGGSSPMKTMELEGLILGAVGAAGVCAIVSPRKTKEFFEEYPTYSRGVAGIAIGMLLRSQQHFLQYMH